LQKPLELLCRRREDNIEVNVEEKVRGRVKLFKITLPCHF